MAPLAFGRGTSRPEPSKVKSLRFIGGQEGVGIGMGNPGEESKITE